MGPFTPHIAEEMWKGLGKEGGLFAGGWPVHDPAWLKADVVEVAVQVNGKLRTRMTVPVGLDEAAARALLEKDEKVRKSLDSGKVQKMIWVKDKLANFIVRTS
jgi:leucyl-tRNA synthetase